jgi:hypothetical protein
LARLVGRLVALAPHSTHFANVSPTCGIPRSSLVDKLKGPPPFIEGAHVHNHLLFFTNPVDSQGRSPDHAVYNPRTLRVRDPDWVKVNKKKMTDAVQQLTL